MWANQWVLASVAVINWAVYQQMQKDQKNNIGYLNDVLVMNKNGHYFWLSKIIYAPI